MKVYPAAISACHVGFGGMTPEAHPLVWRFMKGTQHLCSVIRQSVPSWYLSGSSPTVDVRMLSFKTALLLALVTSKHVSNLCVLSVYPTYTKFASGDTKVPLHPNTAFVPMVISMQYSQAVILLPFHSRPEQRCSGSLISCSSALQTLPRVELCFHSVSHQIVRTIVEAENC